MSSNALFAPSNARNQQKHLIEFKAGKMFMKGNVVHPDKRKGILYVYQSDDALMHFCWKDRQSGTIEDEAKTDKDEENCRRINEVLNNPPSLNSSRNSGGTHDGELQNFLNNMSQQQLMQLFGGVGQMGSLSSLLGTINRPSSSNTRSSANNSSNSTNSSSKTSAISTSSVVSKNSTKPPSSSVFLSNSESKSSTTAGSTSSTADSTSSIQLSDLQNFLNGLGVPGNTDSANLQQETLQSILNNPDTVKELQKYLPSGGSDESNQEENLRNTIACPQFQQALRTFSTALQSGQLGPVVQQFEVGSDAVQAANQGNMEEFVKALQNARIDSGNESNKQPEKRKTADDSGTEAKKKDNKDNDKTTENW
ncbi:hypothetical protein PGB90_001639 [Kerria lacca]